MPNDRGFNPLWLGVATIMTISPSTAGAQQRWDRVVDDPQRRFAVLRAFNLEAVLDRQTGLVWERAADPFARDYEIAFGACLRRATGGVSGWRLPTIEELHSLLTPLGEVGPATVFGFKEGHPFDVGFAPGTPATEELPIWSRSLTLPDQFGNEQAYGLILSEHQTFGLQGAFAKIRRGAGPAAGIWCVRGPTNHTQPF